MLIDDLKRWRVILASASPRRSDLLRSLDIDFEIRVADIDENYPDDLGSEKIALFLAERKAQAISSDIQENELVISADTVVIQGDEILNKPSGREDAIRMLRLLSGNRHSVITGVCFNSIMGLHSFSSITMVKFKRLDDSEISYYVDKYKPFDKAGSYGIQEWIGFIGVEHIEGSYFNVMGLPVQHLYRELEDYLSKNG